MNLLVLSTAKIYFVLNCHLYFEMHTIYLVLKGEQRRFRRSCAFVCLFRASAAAMQRVYKRRVRPRLHASIRGVFRLLDYWVVFFIFVERLLHLEHSINKQTVKTLVRRRMMWCLIYVCIISLCQMNKT